MYVEIRSLSMHDGRLSRTRLGRVELVSGDLVFDQGVQQFQHLRPRASHDAPGIDPDADPESWLKALPQYLTNGYLEAQFYP